MAFEKEAALKAAASSDSPTIFEKIINKEIPANAVYEEDKTLYRRGHSMESEGVKPKKLSCSVYFDALWFCYSPVHQMQQYYRLGSLDNCSHKWSLLYDCLNLKTKNSSQVQEILEAREKAKTHIWTFRIPEEASNNWKELYGHLDEEERHA